MEKEWRSSDQNKLQSMAVMPLATRRCRRHCTEIWRVNRR
jgi:hypothetical protein